MNAGKQVAKHLNNSISITSELINLVRWWADFSRIEVRMSQTIHETGNYSVVKLADKHYVIYYEDKYGVKQVGTYKNELSALKQCERLEQLNR